MLYSDFFECSLPKKRLRIPAVDYVYIMRWKRKFVSYCYYYLLLSSLNYMPNSIFCNPMQMQVIVMIFFKF